GVSMTTGICDKFCDTDADCTAPGGLCLIQLDDGTGNSIPNVTLCTTNCSPISNSGCPTVTGCQLRQETMGQRRTLTACEGTGLGTHNSPCDPTQNDCAAKFGCFNVGTMAMPQYACLKYCNYNNPVCPGVQSCLDIGVNFGGVEYGACD